MLISAKLVPTYDYPVLEEFWRTADELGFHGLWTYDHFYGLMDPDQITFEGWTILAGMAALTRNSRIGCLVGSITYRNPAQLAKIAVTIDHMSGGRLEFGIGAGWHEPEHRGYGIEFPGPGARVEMLDEALTVIRRLWTEDRVSFAGKHVTVDDAIAYPKPLQQPHPPIVIGGTKPKMLRVVAKHADEWNSVGQGPAEWARLSGALDAACAEVGRTASDIRRSVQLFVHPQNPQQVEEQLAAIPGYAEAGCGHVVLSFYEPPDEALLRRCATL